MPAAAGGGSSTGGSLTERIPATEADVDRVEEGTGAGGGASGGGEGLHHFDIQTPAAGNAPWVAAESDTPNLASIPTTLQDSAVKGEGESIFDDQSRSAFANVDRDPNASYIGRRNAPGGGSDAE